MSTLSYRPTSNGTGGNIAFTIDSFSESEIEVYVDGVKRTNGGSGTFDYNIPNYTATGGTVTWVGTAPSSGNKVRIERRTKVLNNSGNTVEGKATFSAGAAVKATDLNNNTKQVLRAVQELQDGLIQTYDIEPAAITTAKIAADAVSNFQLANNSVDSENYVDGSIDTAHIGDAQVTTAKIAADSVTGAKIADDQINSEHYVDGSIDTAHIADAQITTAKIADGAVTSAKFGSNTVTTSAIADANITTAKIAADAVTNAKIADDSIDSEHYVDGSIDTAHIGNLQVTTAKIAADAIDGTKIADDSINSEHYVDGSIDTAHIADSQITSAKIASNAVTTDKIADSELSTLAGMQSATASKLASGTALTADIADLNQIDGMAKQTTITDDDTKFPTSGAVVDYVAAQLEPFGGFEAIANESSFPNTQPVSGVAISIADAGGMSVSNTGTASGATVGGTTVNISGIPSNFHSSTVAAGIRFIVTSTGSGQNYTYHKATLKEDDLINLSGDINDFSERYRVGSSNPTTSLDSGDLFFNTGTGKLLVYNGTNSAWEEAQSVGNFFINTISSSSATGGGSATPNGTAYRFTLSNAGTNAEQHIVSVDGVVQKPNSGSSQPSEGFAVSGADIIFGSAPVSGASIFVITIGSTVNIGTPSNNTVTTAILQNGSVTTAKIVDASVTTAKIVDANVTAAKIATQTITATQLADNAVITDRITNNAVTTSKIANDAVTADKLADTSVTAGSYGSSTSIPSITVDAQGRITAASGNTVNTDLVGDTSPQLGGDLDTNGFEIDLDDDHSVNFGNDNDLKILHSGTNGSLNNYTGDLIIRTLGNNADDILIDSKDDVIIRVHETDESIKCLGDGAVELYHNNSKKIETTSGGAHITGTLSVDAIDMTDNEKILLGTGDDLEIYHNGSNSIIDSNTGNLEITSDSFYVNNAANNENMIRATANGPVKLFYDNSNKFETTSTGFAAGDLQFRDTSNTDKMLTIGNTDTTTARWSGTRQGLKIAGTNPVLYFKQTSDNKEAYVGGSNGNIYLGASESGNIRFQTSGSGTQTTQRWSVEADGHFAPAANNTYDIGTTTYRVRNLYTNDLHLSNEGSSNDLDGTWGDWTIQEGESDLFLKNNRSGKKYKFNLTEVS